jgi:hypothetical protein
VCVCVLCMLPARTKPNKQRCSAPSSSLSSTRRYCGAGNFSFVLAAAGLSGLGLERDPVAVAAANGAGMSYYIFQSIFSLYSV